ncbi:hypothetical protein [Parablautia sp. Marseille-Q6255]|uniref:hypothetical protein n=1 Tax=Parablautia sp. Marseille-Q6255 TaxID=3039593 RepID=UPI0024BD1FEB|nr:hypothetical protein [Parablautia sp. Marseille-Q6255]
MSGTGGGNYDWYWGHILWQRKGMPFEEWVEKSHSEKMMYIASEQLEMQTPVSAMDRLAKVYIKTARG